MEEAYNPRLKKLILEVVDNQLNENNPPITKVTLRRLIRSSYTRQQAKEKIATIVAYHIYYAMHDNIPFDEKKYTEDLKKLT